MKNEAIAILKMAEKIIVEKTHNQRVDQMTINHIELIEDLKMLLLKLRNLLKDKELNKEDEIFIFKFIKPDLLSNILYYKELYKLKLSLPKSNVDIKKDFYNLRLSEIRSYFDNHKDCYAYFRSDCTNKDDFYFTRSNIDFDNAVGNIILDRDPDFSTSYDYKRAMFIAYEKLERFINEKKEDLEHEDIITDFVFIFNGKKYIWTGSKTDLVELGNSLKICSSINNGNLSIKEIMDFLSYIFNIDIGDYYRTYLYIKARKKSRTVYLDLLRDSLLRKMDEEEE